MREVAAVPYSHPHECVPIAYLPCRICPDFSIIYWLMFPSKYLYYHRCQSFFSQLTPFPRLLEI